MDLLKKTLYKDQLNAFILTYCAKADFTISCQEHEFIISKTKIDNLEQILRDMNKYNDYQIIQKILNSLDKIAYTINEKENLFNDIEEMISISKDYNLLKQNTYRGLKHIIM